MADLPGFALKDADGYVLFFGARTSNMKNNPLVLTPEKLREVLSPSIKG